MPRSSAQAPPEPSSSPARDRSRLGLIWYRTIQLAAIASFKLLGGVRATGREHVPASGGALLISNHLSHLDVFVLGQTVRRPLNFMARSTLFVPGLAPMIRSVGGFAIQREGMGASGLKETLRRVRGGGIVTLFPEGTRTLDGDLGPLKPGIASLAARAGVPIVPAGIVGTFEMLPRGRKFPRRHPIRVHYGPPIVPKDLEGLEAEQVADLIRGRMLDCIDQARKTLARDLGRDETAGRD